MNIKELNRLAKACRKVGITHFKNAEFEFTLGDEPAPVPASKIGAASETSSVEVKFTTDTPTEEELMFWSAGNGGIDITSEEDTSN